MVTFLILLLFAIIFLVAGGVMLYFRSRSQQKTGLMTQTETSNASDVSSLAPGTLVEVKGTLRCEEPLTSEISGKTCAYYIATVSREYLERDHDDDDVGSDRRTEILSQNHQFAPFSVEDATGSVPVNAEGAEVDAREVVNRFERNTGNEGPSISLGGATLNLGGASASSAIVTRRASCLSTLLSMCWGLCRRAVRSAPPARRGWASLRRQPPL